MKLHAHITLSTARDNTNTAQTDLNTKQDTLNSATTAVQVQTAVVALDQSAANANCDRGTHRRI